LTAAGAGNGCGVLRCAQNDIALKCIRKSKPLPAVESDKWGGDVSKSAAQLSKDLPRAHIAAAEVWGGNCKIEHEVRLPNLDGWVYCNPFPPGKCGGDVYLFSSCSAEVTTRVVLADVSGHGRGYGVAANKLRKLIARHINVHDQSELMRDLNAEVLQAHQKYATAVVFGVHRQSGNTVFTTAGHPPALWFHAASQEWRLLHHETEHAIAIEDVPIGLIEGSNYSQTAIQLQLGDVLILYTDGFAEAANTEGTELGYEGLLALATKCDGNSPASCGSQLVAAVSAFQGRELYDDDCSLIVLKRTDECPG